MRYLTARNIETDDVISLVIAKVLPVGDLLWERMEMDLSVWIESLKFCELEEITKDEWECYIAFGLFPVPIRILAWEDARFVGADNGVERVADKKWHWTFHEATDLVSRM
jgi:hypothetical protein